MADSFFDGTLDDFLGDGDLFELMEAARPLCSSFHPRSLGAAPVRIDAQESRQLSCSGLPGAIGDHPSLFQTGRVQEAFVLSSDNLGAGSASNPTRPGPADKSTVAASPHPEHSLFNTAPRNQENLSPPAFQPDSLTHSASTRPVLGALLNSSHSPLLPLHGLPDLSASSFSRQRSRSDIFPPQSQPQDIPRILHQRRRPHQFHARGSTTAVTHGPTLDLPHRHTDPSSPGSPTMSTSSRRRSSRPTDLSLPSAPSHARPPSRSSGNPRRSAPRPLQPEQASSATKRKREADDDVDLFGDDLFGGAEVVDLVDTDEVPANILESQGKVKKLVRLSSFDCVICMDSAKDLTVTHCGHLFCSACLHSALNMEVTRRICPICRQKIDRPTAANGKFGRNAKGFYPLELKLMTRKTLGGTVDPPQ